MKPSPLYAESPGAETDLELARSIARKLCCDSLAWAKTIIASTGHGRARRGDVSGGRAPLLEQMFAEVLAYGCCLLEMRWSAAWPAEREAFVRQVRHECAALIEQAQWWRRNRHRRLPSPGGSRYAQMFPAHGTDDRHRARLTREMFAQFCRCTGLGSDVLVGKGENLATLVFYIAAHGVVSADGLPTRQAVLKLLQSAQACRAHLQKAIAEWVAARPDGLPNGIRSLPPIR